MSGHNILPLFSSLCDANWNVAARTFGSSHATLIGVLGEWWIRQSPSSHTVLDGAPSHGNGNAGWCDLMLCRDEMPVGIVEVEGTKPLQKLETLNSYFVSDRKEMSDISFGMLLVYSYAPKGSGCNRNYPKAVTPDVHSATIDLTSKNTEKPLILIAVDKHIDNNRSTIRAVSQYYSGTTNRVTASLFLNGKVIDSKILFEKASA